MENSKGPFHDMERSCALYNSRKAARVLTDLYEAILAPSGVHATQFMLLVGIKSYEPVSMTNLAQGLHTDRTTLTRTLKPLLEKEWITVSPGEDKRVQEVRLTAGGNEALVRAVPLWEQAQQKVQEHLGKESWGQLLTQLQASASIAPR